MCFPRVLIATLSTSLFVSSLRSDTSANERAFARERSALTCMNGPTDEPSCGGTDMDVYLRGEEVRKLDWWVEMSNKWVHEEYFLVALSLCWSSRPSRRSMTHMESYSPSQSSSHASGIA